MHALRPLSPFQYIVAVLVLATSVAVAQPTAQAVVVDDAPQVLLSVTKGDHEGTFNCRAKNVAVESLLRALSKQAQINVVIAREVQGQSAADVDVRDTPIEPLLQVVAKALDLTVRREGNVWFFSAAPATQQVECALRVLDATTADLEALFAAHSDPTEQFRLPRGVSLLLGKLGPDLNKLLSSGQVTIVNEPHVVTADGQEAEISFATAHDPAPDISFPGFRPGSFANSFWVLPHVKDQDHVAVTLAISVCWPNMEPGPRARRPAGTDYSIRVNLPQLTLARGQWLLVRGCNLAVDEPATAAARETVVMLSAAPIVPKQ